MSNYNTQLQSNNTDLQTVLQTLQTKAAGGGQVEWSANEDAVITKTISSYTNDRVATIGNYAFYNCSKLTEVSFPAATNIGHCAFYGCSNLTTVSFPAATNIETYAFCNCYKLTEVSFPAATNIGNCAFYGCSNLTTVSFPAATNIEGSAFYDCSKLMEVSFPAATNIGDSAFYNCSGLISLYLTNSYVCILEGVNAFKGARIVGIEGRIYVPTSLVQAYRVAKNWSNYASIITSIDGEYYDAIIYFYISGIRYTAESNMTWNDWCNSTYNTGDFTCGDGFVYEEPDDSAIIFINGNIVLPTDVIMPENYVMTSV